MQIRERVDIEKQKEEFVVKVVEKCWVPVIDDMKRNYARDLSRYTFTTKEKFFEDFGIRFTHHSNKIEGNTLDFKQVRDVILDKITPRGKPVSDVVEIQAHHEIYHEILDTAEPLSMSLILHWHEMLFRGSNPQIAGQIRNGPVLIAGSNYVPPASRIEVDLGLETLFKWHDDNVHRIHPVLLACITSFRLASIHPFDDGNGRMSRVVMNYILHKSGYPMFNIEFKSREGYYNALEAANLKNDDMRFVHWFFTRYIKANQRYVLIARKKSR
ncbi:MAG: Fic family protein [Candidatus Sigynarchaeota archaeon]